MKEDGNIIFEELKQSLIKIKKEKERIENKIRLSNNLEEINEYKKKLEKLELQEKKFGEEGACKKVINKLQYKLKYLTEELENSEKTQSPEYFR